MAMQSGFIKRIRDIMRMDAGINGDAQRIEQMVWMLFLKVYDAKEDDWELNEDNYESIIPEDLRWRNWAKADSNGHAMTGDKLLNFVNNTLFPVLKGNDVKEGDTIVYEGIKVTPDTPIKKAIVKSTFEDANNYMKDGVYLRQVIDVIDEIEFDDVKESHAFGFVYEEILRELQSAGSSGEFYTPRAVTEFMALMIKPKLGEKMADFACGTGGFITSWLGQLSKQVTDTISVIIEASFFLHLLDGRSITQNGRWITKKVDYREIYQKVPKRIDRWKLVRLLKKNHCCTQMRWNYGTNDFVLPDNQHSR